MFKRFINYAVLIVSFVLFASNVSAQLNETFDKFKVWYEANKDSEKAKEIKNKFVSEMNQFVNKTSEFVNDVKNNPELKEKFDTGIYVIQGVSKKVVDALEDGVNNVLENENVAKTIDTVSDKVVEVLKDEKVQKGINATKKGILNVATKAYEGLKKTLGDLEE